MVSREDEMDAVRAIFSDCCTVSDRISDSGACSLTLNLSCDEDPDRAALICCHLPLGYPAANCATFELSAPWMHRRNKSLLEAQLNEVYAQHVGEPILFQWTEQIREFLNNYSEHTFEQDTDFLSNNNTNTENTYISAENTVSNSTASTSYDQEIEPENSDYKHFDKDNTEDSSNCGLKIISGKPFNDRKSTFQAHCAPVSTRDEAALVLDTLKANNKIARATHNIYAYRILPNRAPHPEAKRNAKNDVTSTVILSDCEDDGEHGAGAKLLHLLEVMNAENVIVVVTRWYGGIHLGPDRFRHINNVAREILVTGGFDARLQSSQSTEHTGGAATQTNCSDKKHKRNKPTKR